MLTTAIVEEILASIPPLKIGVLGDLFLDRYLDLDAALTEPSIETGLDAYQVVRVRSYPGAAGTVINNLVALGVGQITPISMVGDDGEGYELRQALQAMPSVYLENLVVSPLRRTPTYTKPMLCKVGALACELNRLDIKNRQTLPTDVEAKILEMLSATWASFDALLVLDQVSEPECGVVTARVRQRLAELGATNRRKIVIADSRHQIGLFRNVCLKPNEGECLRAAREVGDVGGVSGAIVSLARRTDRPVFCTRGEKGMLVAEDPDMAPIQVPGYPVDGPIDIVGAGDSSSAALASALAGGANRLHAAAFANLIASITIQQIATTGTASPTQIRERWSELS